MLRKLQLLPIDHGSFGWTDQVRLVELKLFLTLGLFVWHQTLKHRGTYGYLCDTKEPTRSPTSKKILKTLR